MSPLLRVRPCFLVIDAEHAGSVSARKLVLETAKYNVVTAYSAVEAVSTLEKYPALDAVVVSASLREEGIASLEQRLAAEPTRPLIIVGDTMTSSLSHLPHASVESFAPAKLLEKLRQLFPAEAATLQRREVELEEEGK